jgi:hypothetical protein
MATTTKLRKAPRYCSFNEATVQVHYRRTGRKLCGQPAFQQELASAAEFVGNPATSVVNFWRCANGLVMSGGSNLDKSVVRMK